MVKWAGAEKRLTQRTKRGSIEGTDLGRDGEWKDEFTTEGTEDTESEGGCRERCQEGPCTYSILGGGTLGMELHYLLDDLFYIGDAAEGDLDWGYEIVVAAGDGVGNDEDVAGAVGVLTVLDRDDVGGGVGLYRAVAAAGDDHDALVGDGVNGIAPSEEV